MKLTANNKFNLYIIGLVALVAAYYFYVKDKLKKEIAKGVREVKAIKPLSLVGDTYKEEKEIATTLINKVDQPTIVVKAPIKESDLVKASISKVEDMEAKALQKVYIS